MGLDSIKQQMAIVKKSDASIDALNSYVDSLNTIMVELESIWSNNSDRNCIISALASCAEYAADISYDYSMFSANSLSWLKQIDKLEKLVSCQISGKSIKKKSVRKSLDYCTSPKDKISIKLSDVESCAKKISKYGSKLDAVHAQTNVIGKQIDSLIIKKFNGSKYSISSINKRIKTLKLKNDKVANALDQIVSIYQQKNSALKSVAENLGLNGNSSGQVSGTVEQTEVDNATVDVNGLVQATTYMRIRGRVNKKKESAVVTWPEEKKYSLEIGEISSKTQPDEIISYIQARNAQIPSPQSGGCTRYTRDKLAVLGITLRTYHNGNDWYNGLVSGEYLTDESKEKVDIENYDGDEFWTQLENHTIQQPIYNLVISYYGSSQASASAQTYGHVLFIDAIVDGVVYFTDNWGYTKSVQSKTISEFRKIYTAQNYVQQGVVHFVEK